MQLIVAETGRCGVLQALKNVLKLLVELMAQWQHILTEKAQATFHEPVSSAAAKSAPFSPLVCSSACLPELCCSASSCHVCFFLLTSQHLH